MPPLHTVVTARSMHLAALISTPTKVCSVLRLCIVPLFPTDHTHRSVVYNHVLRLDLDNLQWTLVDNYGDIPGVRMGN